MNTQHTTDSTGPVTVRGFRLAATSAPATAPTTPRYPLTSREVAAMVQEIVAIEADPSTWRREQAKTAAS